MTEDSGGHPDRQEATTVAIAGRQWYLDGCLTYPGTRAEGLLMNVRMVNAVFEDRGRPDFDASANTSRFVARIPDYVAHGIRAFTICLQGGFPGYEGAVNSAFDPNGSLREDYLSRVKSVIDACDRARAAIILGCYYQRQAAILKDESALRAGVVNVVRWITGESFGNVMLDITNEYGHDGFTHPMLVSPKGQVELIRLAKESAPDLPVSTSRQGHKGLHSAVCEASDFVLVHFNRVPVEEIPELIAPLKTYGKPIMCNEDRKVGREGARAAEVCVANNCSWGLMAREVNQYHPPFRFDGHSDDPEVYSKLRELTTAPKEPRRFDATNLPRN